MSDPLRPAPGWVYAIECYLSFLQAHLGRMPWAVASCLQTFSWQVAEEAPRSVDCTLACVDRWVVARLATTDSATIILREVNFVYGLLKWMQRNGVIAWNVSSSLLVRRQGRTSSGLPVTVGPLRAAVIGRVVKAAHHE